ncbi:MAG: hypothetical protein WCI63_00795 [bacterium]
MGFLGGKKTQARATIELLAFVGISWIILTKNKYRHWHLFCRCDERLEDLTDREHQPIVGSLALDGSQNIYYYTQCLDCQLKEYRPETQVSKAMGCSA